MASRRHQMSRGATPRYSHITGASTSPARSPASLPASCWTRPHQRYYDDAAADAARLDLLSSTAVRQVILTMRGNSDATFDITRAGHAYMLKPFFAVIGERAHERRAFLGGGIGATMTQFPSAYERRPAMIDTLDLTKAAARRQAMHALYNTGDTPATTLAIAI